MRVLFITCRNIYNTCGELRLIKNRSEVLRKEYSIDTEYVVFKSTRILSKPQEIIPNVGYSSVLYKTPIDVFLKYGELRGVIKNKLKNNHYDLIILSGILVIPLISSIKKYSNSVRVIADFHGTEKELIEFRTGHVIKDFIRRVYYRLGDIIGKRFFNQFDGFLCVSNALMNHVKEQYNIKSDHFFIVPCALQYHSIDINTCKQYRREAREKYGLDDDELVFIYSGGTSPWQCISESVGLFNRIKISIKDKKAKMLIFSGDRSFIERFKSKDIIVDSLDSTDVFKCLCAGDYAFMLRGDYVTNNVAYPNKFLEYVSAGLMVIASPYVYDVANQIQEYNVGLIVNTGEDNPQIPTAWNNNYMCDISKRDNLLNKTSFVNTLKPLVDYIIYK